MSVKGSMQELFHNKDNITLSRFMEKDVIIFYSDIKSIDYQFADNLNYGFLKFIETYGNSEYFVFRKKSNTKVTKLLAHIEKKNESIELNEVSQKFTFKEVFKLYSPGGKILYIIACTVPFMVAFFMFLEINSSLFNFDGSETNLPQEKIENTTQTIEYTAYTVDKMMNDLDSNPMAASDKYKDQYLEITGKLGTIDSSGEYISVLPNDDFAFIGVHCTIQSDEQRDKIKTMSVDDLITLKGKCTDVGEIMGYSFDIESVESAPSLISEEIEDTIYNVGDVFENNKIKIMYMDCGDYPVDDEFLQPSSGNKYIFAEFSITNVGDDDLIAGAAYFTCYAGNTNAEQAYIISPDSALESIAELSSDKNIIGKVVFEVPKNSGKIELEYDLDYLSGKKVHFAFE